MRKMQDLLDLLEKKIDFCQTKQGNFHNNLHFLLDFRALTMLRPKNNANEDPQHVCVNIE